LHQSGGPEWATLFAALAHDPTRDDVWSEVYVALWPYLADWVLARYGLDPATAADVVQEALSDYRAKLLAGRVEQPSLPHVRGFVRIAALGALRSQSRFVSLDDLDEEPASESPEDDRMRALLVDQALDRLDHRCAYVLRARYYEGLSAREIAARLGLEPGNVDVLLHRCRARCRELVERGSLKRR
jgi:RNA polymerase sigma factor (sigma-70 family)